jgi:Tol biopolymer transport system component/DNA-binding winged helix-turn-helix (wHTH) protein
MVGKIVVECRPPSPRDLVAVDPAKTQDVIYFGNDTELDLRAFELRRRGRVLKLERLPMDILIFLIERRGKLVTRDQIAERIWGKGTYLDTDNSLNGAIRKIRVVLNDNPEEPRFIQTVTGRGYRFISPLAEALPTETVKEAVRIGSNSNEELRSPAEQQPGSLRNESPGSGRKWRWLGLAALVGALVAMVIWGVVARRPRHAPFESVKTYRVTSTGKVFKAAISPDGRYIAHTFRIAGEESLRVRQAKLLNDIEIVPAQGLRYLGITFSNNSEMIYYVAHATSDEPGTLYRIAVMGGPSEKIKAGLDSPVTFAPDGKRYAFVRESADESSLIIAELNSDKERVLVSRKLPEVLDYPAWSPDGRVVAFSEYNSMIASTTGSNAHLLEARVDDGAARDITKQAWGNIKKIAWLQNGRGLILSAREPVEAGLLHLWYVTYPEGAERQITEGLTWEVEASVSSDSQQIITVQQNTVSSIWTTDARGENPKLVVPGESGSSGPAWIPGGGIAFEEELQGQRSIWSVDADGKNRKQLLPEGNSYDHSAAGRVGKLAFISDRSGVPAVWTMDADGGDLTMAATPTGEPVPEGTVPQISPDGKWIAFASAGSGHWTTLWRVSSHGGKPVELNDKLWFRPAISANGKWIAGFYDERRLSTQTFPTSIAIIASEGGTPFKVFPIPGSVRLSGGLRWSADDRELFYINREKSGDNIWAQPIDGSPAHPVTHFQGLTLFSFDWSPDGKRLAFSRGVQASDVMLIEDIGQKVQAAVK